MLVGIDTNALVYYIDKSSPYHKEAVRKIEYLAENSLGVVTQQNIVELMVVLTGKLGLNYSLSLEYARTFSEVFPVLTPLEETLEILLQIVKEKNIKGIRLFDYYFAATLLTYGITRIYTYNRVDFRGIKNVSFWSGEK